VRTPTGSFRMHHNGAEIENDIYWEGLPGRREGASLQLWMTLVRSAKVILDVGANTGLYALVAKSLNPTAVVHGFEPIPRLAARFSANCRLNGFDITVHASAASDTDGIGTLADLGGESPSASTLEPDVHALRPESYTPVQVPTVRLDTLIAADTVPEPDLLKIDVEGHEPSVLEGLGPHLAARRPTLLTEVLSDDVGRRVESLLDDLDYRYFDIDDHEGPRRVPHIRKGRHWNYLVCSSEQAVRLGLGE